MTQISKITIPQPCHQPWQQMTPNSNGRHCGQCCKTVTDFTQMTNAEIIGYLYTAKDTCGRFEGSQLAGLNRQLYTDNLQATGFWKRVALIAVLISQFSFFKAHSQIKPGTVHQAADTVTKSYAHNYTLGKIFTPVPVASKTIAGTLTDETNEALPGANVKVSGYNLGTVTDINGKFTIMVPAGATQFTIGLIGYNTKTILIDEKKTDAYLIKFTEQQQMLTGDLVVTRLPLYRRLYYRFVKRPLKKCLTDNSKNDIQL